MWKSHSHGIGRGFCSTWAGRACYRAKRPRGSVSEEDSYRREARFYLDAIAPLTGTARAQAVKQVGDALGDALGDVRVLCMALEALVYPIAETAAIERIIEDVNSIAFPLSRSDLSIALNDSRGDLEKKIREAIPKLNKFTKGGVTVRGGFAGESVLDSPSK